MARRSQDATRFPVEMIAVAQQTWAADASDAKNVTVANANGICEQIEVKINNCTNGITATVAIASENSGSLYSQASIGKGATTVYKATSDALSFDAFLVDGDLTVTITPSGVPGASGLTIDVYLYVR